MTYDELARVNGIRDAAQIRVGQRLLIPEASRVLPVEIITPQSSPSLRDAAPPEIVRDNSALAGARDHQFRIWRARPSFHDGIDIAAAEGTPIVAVDGGEVIYSNQLRGYGNIVIIRHAGGIVSVYAHNQINLVRDGRKSIGATSWRSRQHRQSHRAASSF